MCTALSFNTENHYFGRTLDLDCSYGEEVCIVPRRFPFAFRKAGGTDSHYAMIGMAKVTDGVPLFYDAANEHGLSAAGLNFPENAYYAPPQTEKVNITPFEFIPYILSSCKTVSEARLLLGRINIVNIPFNDTIPLSALHWIISDRRETIVVEPMKDGLHVHENPAGVMTNNPPFEYQLFNLNNYRNLKTDNGVNSFSEELPLKSYCCGLGAIGLPGDYSSMSRFVRIAFGRANSVCHEDEASSVSQFFHLLSSVEMPRGSCRASSGKWDISVYSSCINTDRGLYYFVTYDNRQISCVDMHRTDLNGNAVSSFPLINRQKINYLN